MKVMLTFFLFAKKNKAVWKKLKISRLHFLCLQKFILIIFSMFIVFSYVLKRYDTNKHKMSVSLNLKYYLLTDHNL